MKKLSSPRSHVAHGNAYIKAIIYTKLPIAVILSKAKNLTKTTVNIFHSLSFPCCTWECISKTKQLSITLNHQTCNKNSKPTVGCSTLTAPIIPKNKHTKQGAVRILHPTIPLYTRSQSQDWECIPKHKVPTNLIKSIIISTLLLTTINANDCTKCHAGKMQECKVNIHFTLKKAINITRKTFGIKNSNVTLQTLPEPPKSIKEPKDLVDDMLRRKCLRCHLTSQSINPTKNLCLACHNPHSNKADSFKAKATQAKCLKCHNGEFIGTDYLGKFPHDYDKSYRSPIDKNGFYPNAKDGIDYHFLAEDIHHQKGLTCTSCHNKNNGKNWLKPKCTSCHQNLSPANHKSYHNKLSCTACHASWMVNSYNLNIFRDDTPNYKQWKRLTMQYDPKLEQFLINALKAKTPPKPKMLDYLDNKEKPGIWYSGWKFKRWENFILVNAKNGKIELAKPMFQYKLSYKDKNGKIILDNVSQVNGNKLEAFLVKHPHTITKKAKSCEQCHNNPILFDKNKINIPLFQGKLIDATPLNKKQLEKMQSKKYKIERAKLLFNK